MRRLRAPKHVTKIIHLIHSIKYDCVDSVKEINGNMHKPLFPSVAHTTIEIYYVILNIDTELFISFQISDVVTVNDEESIKVKEFKVTIKYASEINLETLSSYMASGSSMVPPQTAIQALDVVLRCAPMACG